MLLFKGFFQPRLSLSSKLVPKYRRSFFTFFSCPSQKCKYRHSQNRRLTADRVVRRRQCTVCVTCRSTSTLCMTTCRQHRRRAVLCNKNTTSVSLPILYILVPKTNASFSAFRKQESWRPSNLQPLVGPGIGGHFPAGAKVSFPTLLVRLWRPPRHVT
jgi:hypothetical protein